jgi:hypothetical protein
MRMHGVEILRREAFILFSEHTLLESQQEARRNIKGWGTEEREREIGSCFYSLYSTSSL